VCLEITSNVIFWLGLLILALDFPVLSGFDYIATVGSVFIMLIIYMFALAYQVFRLSLYDDCK
jgi:hypothetical protein